MKKLIAVSMFSVLLLVGCAGFANLQEKWNALTPDAKARIIISDFQGQLNNLFTQGKAYIAANPSKEGEWKSKVVPAFDKANKSLGLVISIGKTSTLTPGQVYANVQDNVTKLIYLLTSLGVIK